jgi:hypothetical protein
MAEELDWDAALVWIDVRFGNDEWRMIALAPKLESSTTWPLWIVVSAKDHQLRRANRREVKPMSKVFKTAFYCHAYF